MNKNKIENRKTVYHLQFSYICNLRIVYIYLENCYSPDSFVLQFFVMNKYLAKLFFYMLKKTS